MKFLFICIAATFTPMTAWAQWSDDLDSYAIGSVNGQGGWQGWDNSPAAAGLVSTNFARSGPNSLEVGGAADTVRTYAGVTSGAWSYSIWQYIPGAFTGTTYFILLDQYADAGPYGWSVQVRFDAASGLITDDNRVENVVYLVRDQWAEIRMDIDLTADTFSMYYNGTLLSEGPWTFWETTTLALAAIDLYANNSSPVYYDDFGLVPLGADACGGGEPEECHEVGGQRLWGAMQIAGTGPGTGLRAFKCWVLTTGATPACEVDENGVLVDYDPVCE